MSWFDANIMTTKMRPAERFACDLIKEFFEANLADSKDKFKLTGIPNLKEYFSGSSWGLVNSFTDMRPTDEDTIKFQKSRYRLNFPDKYQTAYLYILGMAQRVIRMANPGIEPLVVTMSQLTWAEPGKGVGEHVDSELGYKLCHRVHLPVKGVSSVYMRANDFMLHSKPGIAYYLNNRVPHSYVNEDPDFNVFFTIDYIELSKIRQFPNKAFWTKSWPTAESGEPPRVSVIEIDMDANLESST